MAGGYWKDGKIHDEEFEEGEVWDMLGEESAPKFELANVCSLASTSRFSTSSPRMILRSNACTKGESGTRQKLNSAPIKIPEWPHIHGKNGSPWNHGVYCEEEEEEKVPPHELMMRRVARNILPSFSMLEGVGRTLKGRDLTKMRNVVLKMTGFLD